MLDSLFRIARFGIVGVAATLTHLGVAFILSQHTALPLVVVNVIAFMVAFGLSFTGHYYWTFRTSAPTLQSLRRFFVVALCGLGASTAILSGLVALDIGTDIMKLLVSILIIPGVTYVVGKTWAFAEQ